MAMSEEHKAALAKARRESRAVKAYLTSIESRKPGRPVTIESVSTRLGAINKRLETETDVLARLDLYQERLGAEETLKSLKSVTRREEAEKDFVKVAADYSVRKGISYTAWRQAGVPASVLKSAGVPRSRRS